MDNKSASTGKKQILVVDDNVELALSYKEMLEERGFGVSTAPNGVIALKYILNRDVDAVVCDLKMPQLEGDMFYVTVERLKPHLCDRFIFITGMAGNPKFQPFITRQESRVLFKPVSMEKLLETLNALFERQG